MKHSVVMKFLAMFLCAASLLGVLGGGLGIACLSKMELYEKDVNQVREESTWGTAEHIARELAQEYASRELGGAHDNLIDDYYGYGWTYRNWDRIHYRLLDENGEPLEYTWDPEEDPALPGGTLYYTVPIIGQYLKVHSVELQADVDLTGEQTQDGDHFLFDAIPEGGIEVYKVQVTHADGSTTAYGAEEPIGQVERTDGGIRFVGQDSGDPLELGDKGNPSALTLGYVDDQVILEVRNPNGILDSWGYSINDGFQLDIRTRDWLDHPAGQGTVSGEFVLYDAIPQEGASVASMTVTTTEGTYSVGGAPQIGWLSYEEGTGVVQFRAGSPDILEYDGAPVTGIAFTAIGGELLYAAGNTGLYLEEDMGAFRMEAQEQTVVGEFFLVGEILVFRAESDFIGAPVAEEALPEPASVTPPASETAGPWTENPTEATLAPAETEIPDATVVPQTLDLPAAETVPETAAQAVPETTAPGETVPETTAPTVEETAAPEAATEHPDPTAAEATEPTMASTATESVSKEKLHSRSYYDPAFQDRVTAYFSLEMMPNYTLEIALEPGALRNDFQWDLLALLFDLRGLLPYVLGLSALLFAVTAVYLCCAAGRKSGGSEVRAGGLNRIPLDLYLGCGVCLGVGLAALVAVGLDWLDGQMPINMMAGLGLLTAFGICLIFVAFCFACAAQFKTPGGFWWRNSLAGWGVRLLAWCWEKLEALWGWLIANGKTKVLPPVKKLVFWCFGLVRSCFSLAKTILAWVWSLIRGILSWCAERIRRFIALLPLTWQWVLGGGVLLVMCALVWANRHDGWGFVWLLLSLALVLFVARSFGLLHEAARRMGQGDLDTKVEDKTLVGCFQEFARDLNALAGVAVVAAQKQLKSERMKTELITNVSHDIKTPLTSIINYVDLLQKPHTHEEQEVYLEVLARQSQRLKKLIDDLMEMSKASTGNLTVEIQVVDAAEAVNQALGEFADKLEKARLTPVFRQPEKPVRMKADGRLVWRVLSNVLGNAVKYALPGTRLYVDLVEAEGKVILSLKNISREELNVQADELLERFVRGDASRNTEGSGLGLNIAQSLMELQKGQLQLLVDGDLFKVTLVFPGVSE